MLKAFTDYLETLKEQGFKVYIPTNPRTFNYAFIVDSAENIGYVQYSNMTGLEFSTVHKPNKQTGSGFKVDSLLELFIIAPHWVTTSDRKSVIKYKSIDAFLKSLDNVPLTQF